MNVESNESVLWKGKPTQGIVFFKMDFFIIPFTLFWCYNFFNLDFFDLKKMDLFDLPFILIAIYMLFGRFIHDIIIRKKTDYLVTTRNIYISTLFQKNTIRLDQLPTIRHEQSRFGNGSVFFGEKSSGFFSSRRFFYLPSNQEVPCFFKINESQRVYETICSAKKKVLK